MAIAIVTGASGLVGGETCKMLSSTGYQVIGLDNNMRQHFFGEAASSAPNARRLLQEIPDLELLPLDVRDVGAVKKLFTKYGTAIEAVVHAAGQPSHDWAATDPMMDFSVNATGTLILLEALRHHCPQAAFIFTSTNKVYGDNPNLLPVVERETRWELEAPHPFAEHGIDESMSVDHCTHSVFGVSKLAADSMVQEYGRYFGLNTGVFRCGCLTGPAHAGTHLHGFLSYLVRCVVEGRPYVIHGYKGKQVRDNIHAADLVRAFHCFIQNPRPGSVYNMGGSRHSNCSMLEAIHMAQEISGKKLDYQLTDTPRVGDHTWWISDVRRFRRDYPEWQYTYDLRSTMQEIVAAVTAQSSAHSP